MRNQNSTRAFLHSVPTRMLPLWPGLEHSPSIVVNNFQMPLAEVQNIKPALLLILTELCSGLVC